MRLRLTGLDEVRKRVERAQEAAPSEIAGALNEEAERVMTRAKRLTPVDTGTLRASGIVESPEFRRFEVIITLGFGGPAAPYAIFVHERTEIRHTVGQPKFLEDAVIQSVPGFSDRVATAIDIRRMLR